MSRANRVVEPSSEMMRKLYAAKTAVAAQNARVLKCPYCGRSALIVFDDTFGHIQTKCKGCGYEVIFDTSREGRYSS
jgi:DNA-directed RNA polymerase subunit RPC12/RpoP